jgi:cytochrome c biogenesis protein ResB
MQALFAVNLLVVKGLYAEIFYFCGLHMMLCSWYFLVIELFRT